MRKKYSREVVGWKYPPSAWYPRIGLDYKIRGGKELQDYIDGELKEQAAAPMKRKTGPVKKKKVRGKWIAID